MLERIFSLSPPSFARGVKPRTQHPSPDACASCPKVLACKLVPGVSSSTAIHRNFAIGSVRVSRAEGGIERSFRREMRNVCLESWCKKRSVTRKGRILLSSERNGVSRRFLSSLCVSIFFALFFSFFFVFFFSVCFRLKLSKIIED